MFIKAQLLTTHREECLIDHTNKICVLRPVFVLPTLVSTCSCRRKGAPAAHPGAGNGSTKEGYRFMFPPGGGFENHSLTALPFFT